MIGADRFPYESEIDAMLIDAGLRTSMTARRHAIDLVRISEEWLRANPEDPTGLRMKTNSLERIVDGHNRETREKWRAMIRDAASDKAILRQELDRYTAYSRKSPALEHYGPDDLDELLDCILADWPALEYAPRQEKELIHYEPVPARVVLEMIDLLDLNENHVFYDIGSGLGRVNMLVSMLTDAVSVGVEIDRSLTDRAEQIAAGVGLPCPPKYICSDAHAADTTDGTVFFLFTPFVGSTLVDFVEKILAENTGAFVCSYGSCTVSIASIPGIECLDPARVHPYKLGLFSV